LYAILFWLFLHGFVFRLYVAKLFCCNTSSWEGGGFKATYISRHIALLAHPILIGLILFFQAENNNPLNDNLAFYLVVRVLFPAISLPFSCSPRIIWIFEASTNLSDIPACLCTFDTFSLCSCWISKGRFLWPSSGTLSKSQRRFGSSFSFVLELPAERNRQSDVRCRYLASPHPVPPVYCQILG
jgi:hypothetical protein